MKTFTQRFTWLILWLCICTYSFAGSFKPKPYVYSALGITSNRTLNIPMTDLFEYPEEISPDANLDELSVDVIVDSKNEDAIGLYKYEYYAYGKVQQLYLWQYANQKGKIEVDIKLTYNGEEVINTLQFDIKGVIAKDDSYDPAPGETLLADILSNDQFMIYAQKNTVKLVIDEQTQLGTAKIVEGSPYQIEYTTQPNIGNYSTDRLKYTITTEDGESSSATVYFNIHQNSYASKVLDFLPAPGQFTNEAIAQSTSGEYVIGNTSSMVSLGGFGGYIVLGFDQPIVNRPENPYGVDFSVAGNSFIGNLYGVWSEPAAVQVMKDLNGNGIPDDGEWYELAGSDYYLSTTQKNVEMTYYNPHYDVRYTIPWSTNHGEKGALLTNMFHQHSYYPDPFDFNCNKDSLTYTGNVIKSSLDLSTPSYVEFYRAPAFGYCDNRGYNRNNLADALNPYYNDEKGNAGDGFDLSWAVDKDGNHVELDTVHFVRIYTAGSANAGWLGEWSSEVLKVAITTPDPNYVPKDYYLNYIGITQLQVIKGQSCQYEGFLFKNGRPVKEGTPVWRTSDPSVATVDNTGKITAHSNGETWLYFSQKEDIPTDSIQVKVVELKRVILEMEGNTAATDSTQMIVNESIYITAQCIDSREDELNGSKANRYIYETYNWTTSNPEIGTIDNGLFKAQKAGSTTVYARSTSNPELVDSMVVTVNPTPEVKPVNNPVVIPFNQLSGKFKSSELFTTGNNATIYLNSAISKNGLTTLEIENNILSYNGTGKFGKDTIQFIVTSYQEEKPIELVFEYESVTLGETLELALADNIETRIPMNIDENSGVRIGSWISSDNNIISVKNYGEITLGGKLGTATVYANVIINGKIVSSNKCQVTVLAPEIPVESIFFTEENVSLNFSESKQYQANVLPENASFKKVVYESSDKNIVTVSADGSIKANSTKGSVVIKATSAEGGQTASYTVEVSSLNPVTEIILEEGKTIEMELNDIYKPVVSVLPEDAENKTVSYTIANTEIASFYQENIVAAKVGITTLTATAKDGYGATATVTLIVKAPNYEPYGDYTDGTFILNEDWFGHNNGTINYLTENHEWIYRSYQRENQGKELGTTSQYATIYGDKMYILSKQPAKGNSTEDTGTRLVIANAKTLVKEKGIDDIGGDGRSFVGITPQKGYIGTSGNITIFNIENQELIGTIPGSNKQTGLMAHAGDYVFAVQQGVLLIIDAKADTIVQKIEESFATLTQSMDGDIWAAKSNALVRFNPETLEKEELALPEGITISSSWGAWNAGSLCADIKNNVLYWYGGSSKFYRYEIGSDISELIPFFDIANLEGSEPGKKQTIYGSGCRYDSRTNELIITTIQSGWGTSYENNWVHFVDGNTGELKKTIQPKNYYWFPAVTVFPDKYAPEVIGLDETISINNAETLSISLYDKVTDKDNLDVNIVKAITSISDPEVIEATIIDNELVITALKAGSATTTLQVMSNGKVVEKEIAVTVSNPDNIEENSILRNAYINGNELTITNCAGYHFILFNGNGQAIMSIEADSEMHTSTIQVPDGIYYLKGTNNSDTVTFKIATK